jgi:hypothetical protein
MRECMNRAAAGRGSRGTAAWTVEDEERGLASALQARIGVLDGVLERFGRVPSRRGGPETPRHPLTHDSAVKFLEEELVALPRYEVELGQLREAYAAFVEAVNAFWIFAERERVVQRVLSAWKKDRRKRLASTSVDSDDLSAEGTLALRAQLIAYAQLSDRRVPLVAYARAGLFRTFDRLLSTEEMYVPLETVERAGDSTSEQENE